MLKLMHGEIYRMLRKKSIYVYFGALAAGYLILAFIRSGGFKEESAVSDALSLFILLPALVGGFLFAAIYTDDLNSKNLITLVGYGVNKSAIILSKFVIMALSGIVIFGLVPLYHLAVYALLGRAAPADAAAMIFAISLKHLLTSLAYAALSGIVVYGLQRATFAIVSYLLLAFGVIGSLVSVALNMFAPDLTEYLMQGISNRLLTGVLVGGSLTSPVIEYIIYILVSLALSAAAFFRKEMEF